MPTMPLVLIFGALKYVVDALGRFLIRFVLCDLQVKSSFQLEGVVPRGFKSARASIRHRGTGRRSIRRCAPAAFPYMGD